MKIVLITTYNKIHGLVCLVITLWVLGLDFSQSPRNNSRRISHISYDIQDSQSLIKVVREVIRNVDLKGSRLQIICILEREKMIIHRV